MKRIIVMSAFAFFMLSPFSLTSDGAYNNITKTIYCNNYSSCVHEVGHKIDDANDYPSRTWQFSLAVRMYLNDELKSDSASQIALDIFKFQFQHHDGIRNINMNYPMGELYAEIFEMTEGKKELMPERLQRFYDWELAETLLKEYE